MKYTNTVEQVRNESGSVRKADLSRQAVIVATAYSARKGSYGVQFWTPAMIEVGASSNTDGTTSRFVEVL